MTSCVLCGEQIMGRPYETAEGMMCSDSAGCRRRAYRLFVKPPLKLRDGDQPLPIVNDSPSVQSMVIADIQEREKVGIKRYGTALQPFNGRSALRDAYEESIDLSLYLRQMLAEEEVAAAS